MKRKFIYDERNFRALESYTLRSNRDQLGKIQLLPLRVAGSSSQPEVLHGVPFFFYN